MEFLTSSLDDVEEMSGFVEQPVEEMKDELPAGVMPIMVEIWDQDVTSGEFVGEVGAPLKVGRHSYELPLQSNPSRSTKTHGMASKGSLGSVAFDTVVSIERKDPPVACAANPSKICADVVATVTCKSASNLVNTDTLSLTDPYCKVRVKLDEDHPSTKDKTDYVSDTLNPAWGDGVSFTHRWEVELVSPQLEDDEEEPPVAEFVPLTWDRMTSVEQMVSNMRFFIQAKFLDGKKCKDVDASSSSTAQKVCKYLADAEDGVDGTVVHEVAKDTEDEELKASLAKVEEQVWLFGASLAEAKASEEDRFHPGRMGAIHAARRRRRPRGGGGRHRPRPHHGGGGGGGGGGWGVLVFILLFIILLPFGV